MTKTKPPLPEWVQTESEQDGYRIIRHERAPYDLRSTEWWSYGQSGGQLWLNVVTERGALSLQLLLTNYLNPRDRDRGMMPSGALHYHWPAGTQDYLEDGDCDLLPSGRCQSDCGFSIADPGIKAYVEDGEAAAIEWLIGKYQKEFE